MLDGLAPFSDGRWSVHWHSARRRPGLDPRVLRVAVMNAIRALPRNGRSSSPSTTPNGWTTPLRPRSHTGYDDFALIASATPLAAVWSRERVAQRAPASPAGSLFTFIHVDPLDASRSRARRPRHLGLRFPDRSSPRCTTRQAETRSLRSRSCACSGARASRSKPASRLPLPESLHDLVNGRVAALSTESRDFLLAAAAHAHPTIAITEAASGVACADGLEPALDAHVVELDGRANPLHTSSARRRRLRSSLSASPDRDPSTLAELLEDPEARAWQLAASSSSPTRRCGRAGECRGHARARGALRPAALLLDRACELTPTDARRRRCDARSRPRSCTSRPATRGARRHSSVRSSLRCRAGPQRARALVVLARIRSLRGPDEARELFLRVDRRGRGRSPHARTRPRGSQPAASGCSSDSRRRWHTPTSR